MQRKINKFYVEDQPFRWWLISGKGLSIMSMDEFESWCERKGYKKGEGGGMATERWEKHWIRQAKLVTGALPSEC